MTAKSVRVLLSFLIPFGTAKAQAELQRAAGDAWNARDWPAVEQKYSELIKADTTLPMPHLRRGVALTALGRYAEAKKEILSAEQKGLFVGQSAFRLALIHAGSGNVDSAFSQLKRATDAGLPLVPVPGDSLSQIQRLKSDARYQGFLTNIDRNARPCMYDDKYKQFDFWLGSWDVRPRGAPTNPPSRNDITKIDDGCVVQESYTTPVFKGQSFNIYDSSRQKWFQIWVDNTGGLHEYSGNFSDNAMRYEGTTPATPPATGRVATRLTFFKIAPDTVRQFSEVQGSDGKWTTAYDLIYTRRKE